MQKAASSLYRQHHLLRASRIIGALRDVHGYEKAAQRGGRVMWRLSVLRIRAWTIAQIPAGAEGLFIADVPGHGDFQGRCHSLAATQAA